MIHRSRVNGLRLRGGLKDGCTPASWFDSSMLCRCAGLAVRMSTTFVVMQCGFTMLECVWFAIAWIPKVR